MKPSQGRVRVYTISYRWSFLLPVARWLGAFSLLLVALVGASQLVFVDDADALPQWFGVGGASDDVTEEDDDDLGFDDTSVFDDDALLSDDTFADDELLDDELLDDDDLLGDDQLLDDELLTELLEDGVLTDDELALLEDDEVESTPTPTPASETSPSPSPEVGNEEANDEIALGDDESNGLGGSDEEIAALALAPVASAGADQIATKGDLVVLDGTGSSDPKGEGLKYTWRQLQGPKVVLDAVAGAQTSFTSLRDDVTYIFALTVEDEEGEVAADVVTVAVRPETQELIADESASEDVTDNLKAAPPIVRNFLRPFDVVFLLVALLATFISLYDTFFTGFGEKIRELLKRRSTKESDLGRLVHKGRVVDFKTGKPIWAVNVKAKDSSGVVFDSDRTNQNGEFSVSLPVGVYTLDIQVPGFSFSPLAKDYPVREGDVLYTGGSLHIKDQSHGLDLVVPMKPTGEKVGKRRTALLRAWQILQRQGHVWSWGIFVIGSLFNTVLLFMTANLLFLVIELIYVALIVSKVVLESKKRPSFGVVRDAVTHVPLDLAVVRLYEQNSNRLVMTRVTDGLGRFFALPPPGLYRLVVSKTGYATFTKEDVSITSQHDTSVQIKAELVMVLPTSSAVPGLATV